MAVLVGKPAPDFRDRKGKLVKFDGAEHILLSLALKAIAPWRHPGLVLTREEWEDDVSYRKEWIGKIRDDMRYVKSEKRPKYVRPNGEPAEVNPVDDWPDFVVLSLARQIVEKDPEFLEEVRGLLAPLFCIACLQQIDDVIMWNEYGSWGLSVQAAICATQAVAYADGTGIVQNDRGNSSSSKRDFDAMKLLLEKMRAGSKLGGLKSAATRRKTACDPGAVRAAAGAMGWPAVTSGVTNRLAAKFDRTPERIRQILNSK